MSWAGPYVSEVKHFPYFAGESLPTVICNMRTESVEDNKTDIITIDNEDNNESE